MLLKKYSKIETFHIQFLQEMLDVRSTTNKAMVHAETGRYPLSIYVNVCIIKFWFIILNSDVHKLIHIGNHHLLQKQYMGESRVKNI